MSVAESCPTCGQAVELHTGSGGTSSFVKAAEEARDNLRKLVDGMNEEWKAEVSSLRSLLVEAREELDDLAPLAREALESRGREEDLERQLVEAREALREAVADLELAATHIEAAWFSPDCRANPARFVEKAARAREALASLSPSTEGK